MTVSPAIFGAVKELLRSNKITEISIIDDAYYAVPTREAMTAEAITELTQRIQAWQAPSPEFIGLHLNIESETDITDSVLESLFRIRETSPEIFGWFTDYLNIQEQRRASLRPLETLLITELECAVQTLSPDSQFNPERLPQVIFIDYFLDPRDEVANSLQLARNIGERITRAFVEHPKPLVILMSSKDNLTNVMKSQFRDQAKFLGGMFYFVSKKELRSSVSFLLQLAVLVRSLNDGRQIQDFVDAFGGEISTTSLKFTEKVRALSLEDYAYIQKLSLHGEGMPLGDYLLWLFGTYFAHLLFRSVRKQRQSLDAMHFEFIAESDSMPSAEFVDLYSSVVAAEVDELGTHPRTKNANPETEPGPPDPHFGDVFVHDSRQVRMVITGECDLLYAPEDGADRKHRPENSVFIIPGTLEDVATELSDDSLVTSFFPLNGKTYQIRWQFKKVRSVAYGDLRTFMASGGFRRCARIRHPFATLVQTHFTNDLTRVAIPVAPPVLKEVAVSVYRTGPDGHPRTLHPAVPGILYKDKKEHADHVHLKLQTAVQIVEAAQSVLVDTESRLECEPPGLARNRLESIQTRLNSFLAGLDLHMHFRQPFKIKPEKTYPFPNTPVEAVRDEKNLATRLKSAPVVVFIQEEDTIAEQHDIATENNTGSGQPVATPQEPKVDHNQVPNPPDPKGQ